MECILCKKAIEPATKAVELAGGFFDHDAPPFFVVDDSVLAVGYLHFECLEAALAEKIARG